MQFKITVAVSLAIIIGLLWWSSHQYDKGYQAGRDRESARCYKDITAQAEALQSAMHRMRVESREHLQAMQRTQQDERNRLNRHIRKLLQSNAEYKKYYNTVAPPAVLDSIYGVQ
jgi:predicted transcriptional regulator